MTTEFADRLRLEALGLANAITRVQLPELYQKPDATIQDKVAVLLHRENVASTIRRHADELPAFPKPEHWVHIKSGGKYTKLGVVTVQSDGPVTDMQELVLYEGEDGRRWARPASEFEVRFVAGT